MSFDLDTSVAKQADNIASSIREAGKYIGTITRAEALNSSKGTTGLGLSFKTTGGQSADYLDIYTHKSNGEALQGLQTVNAIMACLKLRKINEAPIQCEKWNSQEKKRETVKVNGYPDLMGKSIGLLLQKELQSHSVTGADVEKMTIFGVFSPSTDLTATEVLEGKTNPERLPKMVEALMARPVRDNRDKDKRPTRPTPSGVTVGAFDNLDDDIPF